MCLCTPARALRIRVNSTPIKSELIQLLNHRTDFALLVFFSLSCRQSLSFLILFVGAFYCCHVKFSAHIVNAISDIFFLGNMQRTSRFGKTFTSEMFYYSVCLSGRFQWEWEKAISTCFRRQAKGIKKESRERDGKTGGSNKCNGKKKNIYEWKFNFRNWCNFMIRSHKMNICVCSISLVLAMNCMRR